MIGFEPMIFRLSAECIEPDYATFLRWEQSDSNRQHHDLQSYALPVGAMFP